ncbi:MAG: NusG domain II-containing protein [Vallitaleaceae bacterium]|nr:NusG domain II-containing protein [Vallitaleaceae bacterium]
MKKNDWIIIVVVVVLASAIYLWNNYQSTSVESGAKFVEIKLNGELFERVPLEVNKEIVVESEWGNNVILLDSGIVKMTNADCPDQVCLKTGEIHLVGSNIVCLPHKLSVLIVGSSEDDIDAIIQ